MDDYSRREFLKLLGAGAASTFLPFRNVLGGEQKDKERLEMRVTYPPVFASLPLKFGQEKGIFEKHGLDLRIQNVAGKREALEPLIKGTNDCCITDISRTLLFSDKIGKNIKITSTAYRPPRGSRHFGLLQSGVHDEPKSLKEFAEKLRGSKENSVKLTIGSDVHFLTDSLFRSKDIEVEEDTFYANRSSLTQTIKYLWSGSIFSAVMAEPLLTLVLQVPYFTKPYVISDFSGIRSLPSVFVFRKGVLRNGAEKAKRFYGGWVESVKETNKLSKEKLFSLALNVARNLPGFKGKMENISIPENFEKSFERPEFSLPEPLKNEDYKRVADWALNKGYIDGIADYSSLVDRKVLGSISKK